MTGYPTPVYSPLPAQTQLSSGPKQLELPEQVGPGEAETVEVGVTQIFMKTHHVWGRPGSEEDWATDGLWDSCRGLPFSKKKLISRIYKEFSQIKTKKTRILINV